ncbi:hypothetical protein J2X68_001005 [Streptomyces sp. 3330]|uniref:hypothetical protein n=1 Tax=Streptomyces sp. 3330 TaxID=2817755 RepID=UPI002856FC96|nr:hypothetical protein [Streptomyces sp. 3330]MDR6974327.1 hypothetical protein [Streptomyces sp. 3330]
MTYNAPFAGTDGIRLVLDALAVTREIRQASRRTPLPTIRTRSARWAWADDPKMLTRH